MLSPENNKDADKAIAAARKENLAKNGYNIYSDDRCKSPNEFTMEKADGTEFLVSYDKITRTFTEVKK